VLPFEVTFCDDLTIKGWLGPKFAVDAVTAGLLFELRK
jgi:hypothetical protein